MRELIPRDEDEMAAFLEKVALMNAYLALARAAEKGKIGEAQRAQIEAEAIGQIEQVVKAGDVFPFSVRSAVAQATESLNLIFAKAKTH